jgi:hypothetical protein
MPKKDAETQNADRILEKSVALEKKAFTFEELLTEAKASPGVTTQEIKPCQSVTVETKDRKALLIIEA